MLNVKCFKLREKQYELILYQELYLIQDDKKTSYDYYLFTRKNK